jgi:bacteriorhodopsin
MEWVEFTPDQVAEGIVHVVMAAIFVGVTLLGVALQRKRCRWSG